MKSPGINTRGTEDEPYSAFQVRVAEVSRRVKAKCAALDKFIPRCTYCGETCDPIESGSYCKTNNIRMVSRWAHEKADVEFYRLGHFGGSWHMQVEALAALLDRVRAGEEVI